MFSSLSRKGIVDHFIVIFNFFTDYFLCWPKIAQHKIAQRVENFSWAQCRDLAVNEAPAALWLAQSDGGEGKLTNSEPGPQRDSRARDELMIRGELEEGRNHFWNIQGQPLSTGKHSTTAVEWINHFPCWRLPVVKNYASCSVFCSDKHEYKKL